MIAKHHPTNSAKTNKEWFAELRSTQSESPVDAHRIVSHKPSDLRIIQQRTQAESNVELLRAQQHSTFSIVDKSLFHLLTLVVSVSSAASARVAGRQRARRCASREEKGQGRACVQNRVQLATIVPHSALHGPLYVLDFAFSQEFA